MSKIVFYISSILYIKYFLKQQIEYRPICENTTNN